MGRAAYAAPRCICMTKPILTVTLNPAVDKTVFVPDFHPYKDFRAQSTSVCAGGKGINVSRVLRRLGTPTVATGFLGGKLGEFVSDELRREGIASDFQSISRMTRLSLTVVDPETHGVTRVLEEGPAVRADELLAFKERLTGLLKRCASVIISGRNIPGVPDTIYGTLIEMARGLNVKALLDTSGAPLSLGIKSRPFMIKPNIGEATRLLGERPSTSPNALHTAVKHLHDLGVQIVAITLGAQGAVVSNGREILRARPPDIDVKSPVGSGDSFVGGFFHAWSRQQSFAECVRLAVACGTANATTVDPGDIQEALVQRLLPRVRVDELT